MGQNGDRLTHELYQRGKKRCGRLRTGGQLALRSLLGLFFWRGVTASLIYFLLLQWAKHWFWPFCLHLQRSLGRACPYVCLSAWPGCLASRWGTDQVPGRLPAAEFRESGKTLRPCSVIQQMMDIPSKPGVVGGQANPWGSKWFYCFWVQIWKQQTCRPSWEWECCMGMIAWCCGPYYFDFFLKETFLLVDLNSLPVHGMAFCSLDTLPADDGELTVLLALI